MKKRGLVRKGLISYTKEKRTEEIELTEEYEKELDQIIEKIKEIIQLNKAPSLLNKPYCRKCAYFEFCYADEEDI